MNARFCSIMIAALVLADCAAARPPVPARQSQNKDDQRIVAAEQELFRAEAELRQRKAGASVDCPRACDLTATICRLAERICLLAEQDAADDLQPCCQDARQRCQRARQDTAASCSCDESRSMPPK